jgi:hypothetical protein
MSSLVSQFDAVGNLRVTGFTDLQTGQNPDGHTTITPEEALVGVVLVKNSIIRFSQLKKGSDEAADFMAADGTLAAEDEAVIPSEILSSLNISFGSGIKVNITVGPNREIYEELITKSGAPDANFDLIGSGYLSSVEGGAKLKIPSVEAVTGYRALTEIVLALGIANTPTSVVKSFTNAGGALEGQDHIVTFSDNELANLVGHGAVVEVAVQLRNELGLSTNYQLTLSVKDLAEPATNISYYVKDKRNVTAYFQAPDKTQFANTPVIKSVLSIFSTSIVESSTVYTRVGEAVVDHESTGTGEVNLTGSRNASRVYACDFKFDSDVFVDGVQLVGVIERVIRNSSNQEVRDGLASMPDANGGVILPRILPLDQGSAFYNHSLDIQVTNQGTTRDVSLKFVQLFALLEAARLNGGNITKLELQFIGTPFSQAGSLIDEGDNSYLISNIVDGQNKLVLNIEHNTNTYKVSFIDDGSNKRILVNAFSGGDLTLQTSLSNASLPSSGTIGLKSVAIRDLDSGNSPISPLTNLPADEVRLPAKEVTAQDTIFGNVSGVNAANFKVSNLNSLTNPPSLLSTSHKKEVAITVEHANQSNINVLLEIIKYDPNATQGNEWGSPISIGQMDNVVPDKARTETFNISSHVAFGDLFTIKSKSVLSSQASVQEAGNTFIADQSTGQGVANFNSVSVGLFKVIRAVEAADAVTLTPSRFDPSSEVTVPIDFKRTNDAKNFTDALHDNGTSVKLVYKVILTTEGKVAQATAAGKTVESDSNYFHYLRYIEHSDQYLSYSSSNPDVFTYSPNDTFASDGTGFKAIVETFLEDDTHTFFNRTGLTSNRLSMGSSSSIAAALINRPLFTNISVIKSSEGHELYLSGVNTGGAPITSIDGFVFGEDSSASMEQNTYVRKFEINVSQLTPDMLCAADAAERQRQLDFLKNGSYNNYTNLSDQAAPIGLRITNALSNNPSSYPKATQADFVIPDNMDTADLDAICVIANHKLAFIGLLDSTGGSMAVMP